ncbi:UDP-N-acetylglucosamine--N-acetylmuramyl-(pentapeptide) pyrophosphoryl-undecaprenol N-acetylglucosamine transferase [bacterium]|nr:UDP-N-acetylglucosamine--N-acetylmuramyl-(pentapeptide) pyrophosphoryl-undecaprenol N-acetylglucosamine transferase [bacterium]
MGDLDESNRYDPLILFAGGKTGGHLYPGIAVAEEIKQLEPAAAIAFCGAGFDLPKRECEKRGWPYHEIPAAPIYQTNPIQLIMGIFLNIKGMLRAAALLKRTRPKLVVCCGGYDGFPVSLAARFYSVPIMLLEQNAVPGLTNRVLGPLSDSAAVAFPGRRARPASRRIIVTGNAVRTELLSYRPDQKKFGLESDRVTGMVIGGSAGAHSINLAVIEAAPELAKIDGFQMIIQTGENDRDAVGKAVEQAGLKALVSAYLDPIGPAYATCDFAVARSGGSVFELALLGIPAILVPYPHAAADHQTANARAFARAGAAVLMPDRELTAERLVGEIRRLATDEKLRRGMAAAMKRLRRPDAALEAAKLALETAGRFR